jgi:hypothetical protein
MGEHRPLVAVTFPADTERLAELLGDAAQVEPVADLPDSERTRTLAAADVLFAWNWRRELRPEEGPTLGAKFVQLLSAGADQLPFDQLPPARSSPATSAPTPSRWPSTPWPWHWPC